MGDVRYVKFEDFSNDIRKLDEYKNSLISSVVIGQIDVHNIPVGDFDSADLIPEIDKDAEEENAADESEE